MLAVPVSMRLEILEMDSMMGSGSSKRRLVVYVGAAGIEVVGLRLAG